MRLAILTSHPIQYQTPLFRELAKNTALSPEVFFCWDFGVKPTYDKQFGKMVQWDIPILEGYQYHFLKNLSPWPNSDFWGQINPGIISGLLKGRHDAILIYGWNSFTNWLAIITALLTGLPILLHAENPLNQELQKSKIKLFAKKIIFRLFFSLVKKFLYIGEENKKFYEYYRVPENKLFFTPYAVENDRLRHQAGLLRDQKDKLREKWGIEKNSVVVLFVGKLIAKKNPGDILRAANLVTGRLGKDNLSLVFVGDGSLRSELEKELVSPRLRVHFAGFQNQRVLPEFYALADFLVLPSGLGETWGLVINEAMNFGLPIVASDLVGCVSDLVIPGETGYTFPLGNLRKLADILKIMVQDTSRRIEMGRAAAKKIAGYSHAEDIKAISRALQNL